MRCVCPGPLTGAPRNKRAVFQERIRYSSPVICVKCLHLCKSLPFPQAQKLSGHLRAVLFLCYQEQEGFRNSGVSKIQDEAAAFETPLMYFQPVFERHGESCTCHLQQIIHVMLMENHFL